LSFPIEGPGDRGAFARATEELVRSRRSAFALVVAFAVGSAGPRLRLRSGIWGCFDDRWTMARPSHGGDGVYGVRNERVSRGQVVVSADHMIDVIAGRVIDAPLITITDGRISSVAAQGGAIRTGARKIDLPGMTLLPGLIDMHTHLTSDPRYNGYRYLGFTDNFWTVVGVANAKKTLEAGFTTVRNVGSANFDDVAIKQGIEQGFIVGPRIVPATYAIGATGGHCDATEFPPSIRVPSPQVANGPDELRETVRKLRKYGAEVIKFCGTGGVFSKTDTVGGQQYSLTEMKAIVDEAHMESPREARCRKAGWLSFR